MSSNIEDKNGGGTPHQLNVIYFIDASRTRSFRMPLRRLNIILAFLAIVVIWSVASIFILNGMAKERHQLKEQVSSTLATIFEYQSRYDGVYEMAYPDSKRKGKRIAKGQDRAKKKAAAELKLKEKAEEEKKRAADKKKKELALAKAKADAKAKASAKAKAKADAAKKETAAKTAAKPAATAAGEKPEKSDVKADKPVVTAIEPVIQPGSDSLLLKFKLKNSISPTKSEGHVWAVATFETDDGKTMFLGSPQSLKLNAKGTIRSLGGAHRYSIRHFKQKNFDFPFPAGVSGRFTSIKIGLSDRISAKRSAYVIPVDVKSTKKAGAKTNP